MHMYGKLENSPVDRFFTILEKVPLHDDECLSPSDEQHESVKLLPDKTEPQEEKEIVNPIKLISESECKCKEQMYISNEEKPVFENSNLKKDTNELASSYSDKLVENENGEAEKECGKGKEDESGLIFSSRIQDLINDRECAAEDSKEASHVQEESCGSLFSLSIDSRKHFYAAEVGEKEVSSSPFKMNSSSSKYDEDDEEKENVPYSKDLVTEQSSDKSKPLSDCQCKRRDNVIAVETSLSSWLVESEKSPQKLSVGSSPESEKNYGDRMILGVIASPADIKELNGSPPCCSADDKPGIGTVGRYWRQRGLTGDGADVGLGSCREVSV